MNNLSQKSGTGVLFFSFDNGLVDYSRLTNYATDLVHKNLGLPVCVITDNKDHHPNADVVIERSREDGATRRFYRDYEKDAPWYNVGRELSLDLTPWRHTLVLDADYLVYTDKLLTFKSVPLALSRSVHFLGGERQDHLTHMPMSHMPMYWATVMIFDSHSHEADSFFRWMKKIRKAWPYFSQMAGVDSHLYRNDYVATLALAFIHNGRWSCDHDLPIELVTAGFDCQVRSIKDKGLSLSSKKIPDEFQVQDIDVHVFNKKDLLQCLATGDHNAVSS